MERFSNSLASDFFVGGSSAAIASIVTNPVDCVRMRRQLLNVLRLKSKVSSVYSYHAHKALFNARRNVSARSLQAGLVPCMQHQFVLNAIRLGMFEKLDEGGHLTDERDNCRAPRNVACTALTTAAGAFVSNPFLIAKTKLQKQASRHDLLGVPIHYTSARAVLKEMYHKRGLKALYKGAFASIPITTLASCTQLLTFTLAKERLQELDYFEPNGPAMVLTAAFVAGLFVTAVLTPFDSIVSRFISQPHARNGDGLVFRNYRDVGLKILREEGFLGFYRNLVLSYLRLGPHTLFTLFLWDSARFEKRNASFS